MVENERQPHQCGDSENDQCGLPGRRMPQNDKNRSEIDETREQEEADDRFALRREKRDIDAGQMQDEARDREDQQDSAKAGKI
ncbi:MAG TPA: hypothetical protein VMF32_26255 [Xanthobacteraceae bacterium]|nr:hypothetical protein [Xanthobacteraceae bacterium]